MLGRLAIGYLSPMELANRAFELFRFRLKTTRWFNGIAPPNNM
jgi:hypothetical protein